jgi:hypothetical protein
MRRAAARSKRRQHLMLYGHSNAAKVLKQCPVDRKSKAHESPA